MTQGSLFDAVASPATESTPEKRVADQVPNRFVDPRPLSKCDECESTDCQDVRIHNGQSIRRECRRCSRFMGWLVWYGTPLTSSTDVDPTTSPAVDVNQTKPLDTRSEATKSIAALRLNQQRRILDFLTGRGSRGATDCEICGATGLDGNTVRPRRGELVETGHVVDSGRTRPTPSGRQSHIWTATGKPLS